jgi:predicted lipoprotein with Yx(FWY)xxD motif
MVMTTQRGAAGSPVGLALRIAGAGLLAATGAIHLDLYLTGYRNIPTIGWLFLLQVIAAFALALAVLVSRNWLVAAAGAGFGLATLGGYLLSVWIGLFGFKEVRTTAGIVAGIIEVATFAVLAAYCLIAGDRDEAAAGSGAAARLAERMRASSTALLGAAAGIAAVALVLLGVAVSGASGPAAVAGGTLRTTTINGAHVLTNSKGLTLYWFAPDTTTASKCYGSCASYWPPVKGPASAPGVSGTFGTIRRTDGTLQVTYNGHPLYTYVGDGGPGQAHGNNLNLNGGLWHEVTVQ